MARLTTVRSKWFEYPNDPDKAKLHIKHLKPGELQEIEAKVNTIVGRVSGDPDSGADSKFVTEVDIKPNVRRQEMVKACIIDWEQFFDVKGVPAPCTNEMKLHFLKELDDLYEVVEMCRADLAAEVAEEMEGADPN